MSRKIHLTEEQFREYIKYVLNESVSEMNLYHGTQSDFDKFDTAYMSSGWGQQAHGYGFYLTNDYDTAKQYALDKNVLTVEVPDKGYLNDKSISMTEKQKIANRLFKLFTEEDEERKLSYPDDEIKQCLWDYEIKCILNCNTGEDVYGTVSSLMGDDKETSEFLNRIGYVGLKVKDNTTNSLIYVIFNPNDIKIIKKEKM